MGIFSRFTDILKANINELLDKAEDPEKMIKLVVIEMEEAVNKATMALGKAIANEKMLERQIARKKEQLEDYTEKAKTALKAGREDLAKEALRQKKVLENAISSLEGSLAEAKKVTQVLRGQLEKIRAKLDEAKMRQSTLIARAQAAKAKKEIAQSMSGIGNDVFADFEGFERKIEQEEAEADAFETLAGETDASLDKQLDDLSIDGEVDAELEELKKSLATS